MKRVPLSFTFGIFTISLLSLIAPAMSSAATTPSLGLTESYTVLSSTYTNTTITTISGGIGFTTPPAVVPDGVHLNYGPGAPYAVAGANQGAVLSNLTSQLCTFTFPAGAINLSTDVTHGIVGVYAPGVYCSSGAMEIGGPLTLSGSGTYIFRPAGALTSAANSVVTLIGASACDIFWTPIEATTLAANTVFFGTIIDDAGITIGANSTWVGRALAFGGTVTTDTHTLTVPICLVPLVPPVSPVPSSGSGASLFGAIPMPVIPVTAAVTTSVVTPAISADPILIAALPTTTAVTPTFPLAGHPPGEKSAPWSLIVSGIISLILVASVSLHSILDQKKEA